MAARLDHAGNKEPDHHASLRCRCVKANRIEYRSFMVYENFDAARCLNPIPPPNNAFFKDASGNHFNPQLHFTPLDDPFPSFRTQENQHEKKFTRSTTTR
jgi:hypothetical protein